MDSWLALPTGILHLLAACFDQEDHEWVAEQVVSLTGRRRQSKNHHDHGPHHLLHCAVVCFRLMGVTLSRLWHELHVIAAALDHWPIAEKRFLVDQLFPKPASAVEQVFGAVDQHFDRDWTLWTRSRPPLKFGSTLRQIDRHNKRVDEAQAVLRRRRQAVHACLELNARDRATELLVHWDRADLDRLIEYHGVTPSHLLAQVGQFRPEGFAYSQWTAAQLLQFLTVAHVAPASLSADELATVHYVCGRRASDRQRLREWLSIS